MNPAARGDVRAEELLPLMIGSAHGVSLELMRDGGAEPPPVTGSGTARLVLAGDPGMRPEGLERALIRAGFAVAEATLAAVGQVLPDAVLVTAFDEVDAAGALDVLRLRLAGRVPVILVLHQAGAGAVVRLLQGGAADVMASPVDLAELVARLGARVESHRASAVAVAESAQVARLLDGFVAIAGAIRPEEVFHAIVREVGDAMRLAECACVLAGPGQREGRLVATRDDPRLRDQPVPLERYPEVRDAVRTGVVAASARAVAIPILQQGVPIGAVLLRAADGCPAPDRVRFVERLVAGSARVLESQQRHAAMTRRATAPGLADPLTGCASLDQLDRRLVEEFDRARRYQLRFCLLLIDVDGLGGINQRGGTEAGDRFLTALGEVLNREIRASDFVARYGGDEFALVLPETGIEGARDLVGRVRDRLAQMGDGYATQGLTAGIAAFPHSGVVLPEDLLAMAESALIAAKAAEGARIGVAA